MRSHSSSVPTNSLAGVVLAAGLGTRLHPLTQQKPKPLVAVGGRPLLDWALESLPLPPAAIAVNASYLSDQIVEHLAGSPVHVEVEPAPLGSAGAIANLREWIGDRSVMIRNADVWFSSIPAALWEGWTGEHARLLVRNDGQASDFGTFRYLGWSLLPNAAVGTLASGFGGLFDQFWKAEYGSGRLEFVVYDGEAIDCGTLSDLKRADALASKASQ